MSKDQLSIRQEQPGDHKLVERVIVQAFANVPYSDQSEHQLVARLKASELFIPELSLVAAYKDKIVGHILITRINIEDGDKSYEGLSLAPLSVHPAHQRQGIGAQLIKAAHDIARQMGFNWIVLIGHEKYYPRFGYQVAADHQVTFSIEAPKDNCMIVALKDGILTEIKGQVTYPRVYFG